MTALIPRRVARLTRVARATVDTSTGHKVSDPWWPWSAAAQPVTVAPLALDVRLFIVDRRITAGGELDFATAATLTDLAAVLIQLNPGDSTIDISGLTFIDAAGLGCLVGINNRLYARHARLSVTGVTPKLHRIFDISGLTGLLQPDRPGPAATVCLDQPPLDEGLTRAEQWLLPCPGEDQ
jgi:anti-sigma B factor antagonist